jgi:hypothetical protein
MAVRVAFDYQIVSSSWVVIVWASSPWAGGWDKTYLAHLRWLTAIVNVRWGLQFPHGPMCAPNTWVNAMGAYCTHTSHMLKQRRYIYIFIYIQEERSRVYVYVYLFDIFDKASLHWKRLKAQQSIIRYLSLPDLATSLHIMICML